MTDPATSHLRWRIIEDEFGMNQVTMVVPSHAELNEPELLLETGIKLSSSLPARRVYNWSPKDLILFATLCGHDVQLDHKIHLEINFTDPSIIEIINIVASARFSVETDLCHVDMAPSFATEIKPFNIGEVVTINTDQGFKLAVVVSSGPSELRCVLLEPFYSPDNCDFLGIHDVIRIPRMGVLPAEFGDTLAKEGSVLH